MPMRQDIEDLNEKAKIDFQKNKFPLAASGFRTCLDLLEPEGAALDIAEVRNNLAVALVRTGDFAPALEAVLGTDSVFADANDPRRQGIALANLGSAYEGLKEYDQAAAAYEKAIELFKENGEKKLASITLHTLSDLQLKSGKQYQAIGTLQASYLVKPQANLKDKFFKTVLGQTIQKLFGK